jgi:hypothetical protein
MNSRILSILILLVLCRLISAQTPFTGADSTNKVVTDTAKQNLLLRIEALEAALDSIKAGNESYTARLEDMESGYSRLNKKILAALGLGALALILGLGSYIYTGSRYTKLKNRIYSINNSRDLDELEKKFYEYKKRSGDNIDELSARYDNFYMEFTKAKDVLVNEITGLSLKIDAASSLKSSISESVKRNEPEQTSADESNVQSKHKSFLVEYFVDNGEIKFKETNSGTPFYMDKFDDRSELTVNESSYAPSNYSESIQKCFKVNGSMSGKYRNKKPALCSFDENSGTWNLIQTGELDGI